MSKTTLRGDAAVAIAARVAAPAIIRASAGDVHRYGRKDDDPSPAALAKEVRALADDLKKRDDEIKRWTEKAAEEIKSAGSIAEATKAALAAQATAGEAIATRMAEMEQLIVKLKSGNHGGGPVQTLGQRFVENEDLKKFLEPGMATKGRFSLNVKAITSATSGDGGVGEIIRPDRIPGWITIPDRALIIRDLVSVGRTNSNAVEYVRETGFTNAAAPVAEGTLKPESSINFELDSAPVRTIAHWIIASKQILADIPQLQSYIDTRLRYGLQIVEEQQILAGDGTGQNLLGIIPQATPFDETRMQAGDTKIDAVRRAMTQVRLAEYRADAIVLHPEDWEDIELTKDAEQRYIWANPRGLVGPTLWGLPVVDTTAVEPGEFLVGNFRMSTQIWDREDATVDISTEDRDNFIRNMVTIRAEERLALTMFRPEAMIFGDFHSAVST